MSEQGPDKASAPEAGDNGRPSLLVVINTLFVGAGTLYAVTRSVPITLVTTIGVIALTALLARRI